MRKSSRLKNLCGNITDLLASQKKITEDQILSFMEELAAKSYEEFPDMPDEYKKMSSFMGEIWRYREWEKLTVEQAFLYGGLWGSVRSFEMKYRKNLNEDRMKLLVPKYKDKRWLFRAIKCQPGILHKELAVKGGISPSRLSQIMDDDDMDELISYRLTGREKYYYLKPRGEELLARIGVRRRKTLGSYAAPCKAITVSNDSAEYRYAERIINDVAMDVDGNIYNHVEQIYQMFPIHEEAAIKEMIGDNEWNPVQDYKNEWKVRNSENGFEALLVR